MIRRLYYLLYCPVVAIFVLATSLERLSAEEYSFSADGFQNRTVAGTVRDENGDPVPNVSVRVKDVSVGTSTNLNGNFEIEVPESKDTLLFSSIGFLDKAVYIGSSSNIEVVLIRAEASLDEVVVVGYGEQKKVNLTGSVSVVEGEELAKRQIASTSSALQGMAPGVMVTQQSGLPGADQAQIRIRGVSSMFAGQSPLVLIDNVEMTLDAVDPNNIQSISILKDASAASIYGSRAANGVVLVTTKRGSSDAVSISYNSYMSVQDATNFPKKVDGLGHMELWDVALKNMNRNPVYTDDIERYKENGPDNFTLFNTDWKDLTLTNNGLVHSHNLNINSKGERVSFYTSGSYLSQNGLLPNTDYERIDFRINSDIKLTNTLSGTIDFVLNNNKRKWPGLSSPQEIMRGVIGLPANVAGRFDSGEWGEAWVNINPAAIAHDGGISTLRGQSYIFNSSLTYEPFENLNVSAFYSAKNWKPHEKFFVRQYQVFLPDPANQRLNPGTLYPAENKLTESRGENIQNLFRAQVDYSGGFSNHSWQALVGYSMEEFVATTLGASRRNFVNPDLPYLNIGDVSTMENNGGINDWAILSLYSRINYQFSEKYLLELNGRWDGSSRFSKGNRWGFFPSMSVGYRISEEPFWNSLKDNIQEFKLRASYGLLGNQNLTSYYPTVAQFVPGYNYFFNDELNSGYTVLEAANPNIRWESSKQLDVGLDMSLLNRRLNLSAEWYKRDIYDLLQRLPIPIAVGLSAPFVNVGQIANKGFDIGVSWRDNLSELRYGVQLNLSDVRNKVIDLDSEEYISGLTIKREGYALDSYFGYVAEGLFQSPEEIAEAPFHFANTAPGDVRYRDISGPDGVPDGLIDNFDRTVLGNSFPRYEYSLNIDLAWKNFDFSVFFQGVGKRDNYMSGNGAWAFYSAAFQGTVFEHHRDYWTADNPNASYPRLTLDVDNNYKNSSYWMRSGAYLRVKNMTLGYTIPNSITSRMKIESVRFNISGQNLWTFDEFYQGFDPEQTDNGGAFYPIMRTLTFGLSLKF